MGLWSWLREPWSRPEAAQVSTPTAPVDRAPAAAPDPGWRALPPIQRTLADGVHSAARLGDFAGSLTTWQTPRMLSELEHGRGPSAPSGSAVGIVDAVAGAPGFTQLAAAGVPLTALPRSGTSAAVQREVRFDPPRGAVALQRAMSEAGGPSATVAAPPAGVLPSSAVTPPAVPRSDGLASPGVPVAPAVHTPVSAGTTEPVVEGVPVGPPPSADPSPDPTSTSYAADAPVEPSEPAVQRSAADTGASTRVADQPGPILGSTPLQSPLGGSPAVLQRSAGSAGRALPQLPVVPDRPAVHSFVTAPPPPTARPDLPIVSGGPEVGEGAGVVQRAFAPAPSAAPAVNTATAASAASDGPVPVVADLGIAVPELPGPEPVESSTSDTASLPEAPERAPLLADAPAREVPGEATSVADAAPTVSRLAAGSGPVVQPPSAPPRRLGLGAPLTRPPEQVPPPPDVSSAGPVVQMLSADGPVPAARPAEIPAAGDASMSSGSAISESPAGDVGAQIVPAVDLPTDEQVPSSPPAEASEVGPESISGFAAEPPADPGSGSSWPAAPDHGTPLLGDRPIATAMPEAATPAVQRSAADEVVPVRWGDPTGAGDVARRAGPGTGPGGHAGPGPGSPSGSSQQGGHTGTGRQQGHHAAVQRSVGATTTTTPAGSTTGTTAGALVQRSVGSGAGGDPGSVAVNAGIAQRAADGSVVFHPPSDGPAATPVQRFGLPSLPKMPTVPSLPSMPSLPNVPSLPSMPSLPSCRRGRLPSLPDAEPAVGAGPAVGPAVVAEHAVGPAVVPNLPSGLPSLPSMPSGLPSLPNLPSGLPSLPNMPSACRRCRTCPRACRLFRTCRPVCRRCPAPPLVPACRRYRACPRCRGSPTCRPCRAPSTRSATAPGPPSTPPPVPSVRPPTPRREPSARPPTPPRARSAGRRLREGRGRPGRRCCCRCCRRARRCLHRRARPPPVRPPRRPPQGRAPARP